MRHVHGLAASRSGGCQPRKPTNILRGRDWSVERPLYRIKRLNIPKYSNIAPNFALRSKQTHNLELLLHKQATADTSASSKSVEQPLEQSESAQRISCIESHIQESRRAPNTTPIQVTSPAEELCQAQSSSSAQADTFLGENQTVTLSSSRFFDEKSTSRNTSNSSNNSTTPPEQRTLKAIKQSYADQGYRLVGGPRGFNKMRSHLQFITTPTSDTPGTALLLHFDDKRYIIGNAHEGLQRASLQVGAKVFRAKDIFLTGRTEWRTTGGLLGMVLSHADAANACATSRAETARLKAERQKVREEERGQRKNKQRKKSDGDTSHVTSVSEEPTLRIHGGPNLTHTLATARSFIFRKGTPLKVLENIGTKAGNDTAHDWKPTWADNRIQVWAMPIVSSINGRLDAASKSDSPRKRSLGEFMSGQGPTSTEVSNQGLEQPQVPENQEERNQQLRNLVVSEMFGSEWRYDNLVETPLHKVKMPAALFVRNPVTKMIEAYQGPTPNGKAPVPDIKVLVRSSWPGALVDHLPPTKHSSIAMSYIIRNLKIRGKFKPEAAIALNVRRGRLWTSLTEGSSVQSTDGVTVTPDMVMEKGSEGSGVAVVELPTQDYVHDLVSRPEWEAERVMTGVGAIVWILGPGVIQDETLQAFIGTHSNLQHIVSSSDQCPNSLVLTAAATAAIRHNLIDPLRYAIPIHSNTLSPSAAKLLGEIDQISGICQPAKSGLRIELEPSFRINDEPVVPLLDTGLVVKETPKDVVRLAHAARQEIRSSKVQVETADQDLPSPDAEIICLGTGSALPSHHRNVSATLLRVPGCGSYLIDCGENTLGQLKRMYTPLQLAEILRDLKLIWISHLHADHHLGLTSVIKAWYEEVHGKDPIKRQRPSIIEQMINPAKFLEEGRRLFIVGHRNMMRWLEEYSSVEDFGYDQIVPLQAFPVDAKAIDDCSLEWNGINVGFNVSEDPRVLVHLLNVLTRVVDVDFVIVGDLQFARPLPSQISSPAPSPTAMVRWLSPLLFPLASSSLIAVTAVLQEPSLKLAKTPPYYFMKPPSMTNSKEKQLQRSIPQPARLWQWAWRCKRGE